MSFIVEDKGGSFENVPTGAHLARCYRIVDLGTQKNEYMGEVTTQRKIMIGWEIHGTDDNGQPIKMRDGRPFAVFKNYTLSWHEKATLRRHLQAWRNKPFSQEEMRRFDVETILDKWCMVTIVENAKDGKTYVNVDNISPVPSVIKQAGLPSGINKIEVFKLENPDMALFNSFSDYLKKKIQMSPEWAKVANKAKTVDDIAPTVPVVESLDDLDIPF